METYRVLKEFPGKKKIFKVGDIIERAKDHPRTTMLIDNGFIKRCSPLKLDPIISKSANILIASEDYVEGDKKHFTWDEAMKIGEKVGDGWRLPTRHEWALICEEFGQKDGKLDSDTLIKNIGVGSHGGLDTSGLYTAGYGGYYWSATPHSIGNYAYNLYFYSGYLNPSNNDDRSYGFSVRLVKEI